MVIFQLVVHKRFFLIILVFYVSAYVYFIYTLQIKRRIRFSTLVRLKLILSISFFPRIILSSQRRTTTVQLVRTESSDDASMNFSSLTRHSVHWILLPIVPYRLATFSNRALSLSRNLLPNFFKPYTPIFDICGNRYNNTTDINANFR